MSDVDDMGGMACLRSMADGGEVELVIMAGLVNDGFNLVRHGL